MVVAQSPNPPEFSRKRPWLAVLLTVFVPGLGHIYLRLWGRAILWLALSILASYLLVPDSVVPESFSADAILAASQTIAIESAVVLLGVSLLCMVDVYVMARQINEYVARQETGGDPNAAHRCPNCRKELDPDIDFCHWCTTELDRSESDT